MLKSSNLKLTTVVEIYEGRKGPLVKDVFKFRGKKGRLGTRWNGGEGCTIKA